MVYVVRIQMLQDGDFSGKLESQSLKIKGICQNMSWPRDRGGCCIGD